MAKLTKKHIDLLRDTNFGSVATVDARGRPQTTIVWVDTDGEHVVFNTINSRAKAGHLRDRPEVSVVVWDRDDPYHYFEVEGPAELVEDGATEHIHQLSHKYRGKPHHTPDDRVIVKVAPRRIHNYGLDEA
jgi:PPOX class probable F420-dependent enzyme